jgi:TonB family protein
MKPRMVSTFVFVLCFWFVPAPAYSQQSVGSSSATAQVSAVQQNPNAANAASSRSAIPSYPDSPAGLEELIKDMMKMQKGRDAKNLAPYIQSLILPDPSEWFTATFGDQIGAELTASYERTRIDLPLSFPDILAQLQSKHAGNALATRFTDPCNPDADEAEYPLLLRRANAQPLYDIRFSSGQQYVTMRYFAYVDGAFRWLGNFNLRVPEFAEAKANGAPQPPKLKIGGNVIAAKLINRVQPAYPQDAQERGIQGTVLLHALIDTDGSIQNLQVLQGTCSLADAAVSAVRQWRYSPTMLEGQPVRVDTTISVVFRLGR